MKYRISDISRVLAGCAFTTLLAVMNAGCSDNVQPDLLVGNASEIRFSVSPLDTLDTSDLRNITISSAQLMTTFKVSSNTYWTAEVTDCSGGWCYIDYSQNIDDIPNSDSNVGKGSGIFIVRTAPNRNKESNRECKITVYAIERDGAHLPGHSVEIHLIQECQSLEINYNEDEIVSASGTTDSTEPEVTVTANQEWRVRSSEPWVTVVPGSGMNGNIFIPSGTLTETAEFRLKVDNNPNISVRTCEIILESPNNAFIPTRLTVVQEGSPEASFSVTPVSVPQFSPAGGEFIFMVYSSHKDWTAAAITSGDWININPSAGQASTEPVPVTVTVDSNSERQWREAGIIFSLVEDTEEIIIPLTQAFWPVVSDVRIVSGWTSKQAQICAVCQYPDSFFTLVSCGAVCWPITDESKEKTYSGNFESNTLTVDMYNLEPNTDYIAKAYIEYKENTSDNDGSDSVTVYSTEVHFRTPDRNDEGVVIPKNNNLSALN